MASDYTHLAEPEILRDYLVDLLRGKEELRGAVILSRKAGNLQNEIDRALMREGLLLVVLVQDLPYDGNMSATLLADKTKIVLRATENPTFNKTGKSACYIATRAAAALKLHKPPFPWCGEINPRRTVELNIIPRDPSADDEEEITAWDTEAETKISIQPRSTTN